VRDWLLISSVEGHILSGCKIMLPTINPSISSTTTAENIHMARISRFSVSGSYSFDMALSFSGPNRLARIVAPALIGRQTHNP
jgi:hypothetical protein